MANPRGSSTQRSRPPIRCTILSSVESCITGSRSSGINLIWRWVDSQGFFTLGSLTISWMRSPPLLPNLCLQEWIRIVDYCIKKRLQWNSCFARKVCYESEYYEEMLRYLQKNLAIFPYHLAEYACRVMSATDALKLTGVGRNEFMDIMNKCRSKKIMWKLNKSIASDSLPLEPVDFAIEPWWGICHVNLTLEEFKKLSEEEIAIIDKVSKEEGNSFVQLDPDIVKALYRWGLIYFDVSVSPDDQFKDKSSVFMF